MDAFTIISIVFLGLAGASALVILADVCRHPQPMRVMNAVWPLTALWSGPVGLVAYFAFGRAHNRMAAAAADGTGKDASMHMDASSPMAANTHTPMAAGASMSEPASAPKHMPMSMPDTRPFWQKIALSAFHCGAGCTLADIVGESLGTMALVALSLHGIVAQWVLDYILALGIGMLFQFMAIRPMMRNVPAPKVMLKALKVDCLSLTAWQVGMYTVSGILTLAVFPGISHATPAFWFIMQLAMFGGFACSYPMNIFLVKKGIKPAM